MEMTNWRHALLYILLCCFAAHASAAEIDSSLAPPKAADSEWRYWSEANPMATVKILFAAVYSSNEFELGFPYQGKQHGTLVIREHPRHGKDVIVSIVRGQILCGVSSCSVPVRFDDGPVETFTATGPSDSGTTMLFLSNYKRFMGKLAKAQKVAIAPTVYQNGDQPLVFPVANFDAASFAKPAVSK